jgi:two-component system invasion response regulator UvrY
MDVNMPGMGGMEATRKITLAHPGIKVIIVTVHNEDPYPARLFKAGAAGYLTKGCKADEMITAIREVHAGGNYVSNAIAQSIAMSMLPGRESPLDRLSQVKGDAELTRLAMRYGLLEEAK